MKTRLLCLIGIVAVQCCLIPLSSCDEEAENDEAGTVGVVGAYAPKDIINKTLVLKNEDGSVKLDNDHFKQGVSVNNVTVDYDKYAPSYSYTVTGMNLATYTFNATKKTYIPYYGSYHYSKFSFQVNLIFTSDSGGNYNGTQTNANGTQTNITGTFTLKSVI